MILQLRLEDGARKTIEEVEKCTDVFFPMLIDYRR
jgi:hypothetical protein